MLFWLRYFHFSPCWRHFHVWIFKFSYTKYSFYFIFIIHIIFLDTASRPLWCWYFSTCRAHQIHLRLLPASPLSSVAFILLFHLLMMTELRRELCLPRASATISPTARMPWYLLPLLSPRHAIFLKLATCLQHTRILEGERSLPKVSFDISSPISDFSFYRHTCNYVFIDLALY